MHLNPGGNYTGVYKCKIHHFHFDLFTLLYVCNPQSKNFLNKNINKQKGQWQLSPSQQPPTGNIDLMLPVLVRCQTSRFLHENAGVFLMLLVTFKMKNHNHIHTYTLQTEFNLWIYRLSSSQNLTHDELKSENNKKLLHSVWVPGTEQSAFHIVFILWMFTASL